MKFVTISDTHGNHAALHLPKGDVLIHAGDLSFNGYRQEVIDFLNWFQQQDYKYKIFIAGNHDFFFEQQSKEAIEKLIPENVIYLQDTGISVEGYKIWGSPITPWFYNWAFNRHRGDDINRHWLLIPTDTDILITHGPAFGMLDQNTKGENLGCKNLFERVQQVKPQVHICGHVHEGYGLTEQSNIKFINSSILNEKYELSNPPIVFDLNDGNAARD